MRSTGDGKRSPGAPSSDASVERTAKRQRKEADSPGGPPEASARGEAEEAQPAASAGPAVATASPEAILGALSRPLRPLIGLRGPAHP